MEGMSDGERKRTMDIDDRGRKRRRVDEAKVLKGERGRERRKREERHGVLKEGQDNKKIEKGHNKINK